MVDNFNFDTVSDYKGYVSARDKTNVSKNVLVRGSKNVYKKLSGTISVRDGLKKRGSADTTVAGIASSFEWNTSLGVVRPIRVVAATSAGSDAKLQVESDALTSGTFVWYDLMTGLSKTRFVFDPWWDNTNKKDKLIFVKGDSNLYYWSGGVAGVTSGAGTTLTKSNSAKTWAQDGFDASTLATAGSTTTQFDITNPAGTTFRYTYDGTGTDPLISATTIPIGSYVYLGAQNFAAGNNGFFVVTGVGTNYFEVTNAVGVVESNKTIGSGFVYLNFVKVIDIGGVKYAYTGGENTQTLTGMLPSTAAITSSVAVQAPVLVSTALPASGFNNDFIKVIGNRLHVGSYTSRVIYISANTDFSSFTVPSPRTPGSAELLTLDNAAVGISVRNGNAHISAGTSDWYEILYESITVSTTLTEATKVDKKPVSYLGAALAHEFIDTVGNDIVYISQDQQLRVFGAFRNLAQAKYPSLSQDVQVEFAQENFTGGALRCVGDFIYVTAPVNGRDWMHQTRETVDAAGNVVAERLWHPPQIRNISRFAVISGVLYGHSNANPMIYQVWDTLQWSDDGPAGDALPYTAVMKMSYRNLKGRRQGLMYFDKVYFEGYMTQGTLLYANIYMDYQGNAGIQNITINALQNLAQFFFGINPPSMGTSSLGDNPLGDGLTPDVNDQELLPKFRAIRGVDSVNVFEYDIEIYSSDLDCRWEILSEGANPVIAPQQATFLRK
ncbi:MAG: hypothetical protein V4438_04235 [Patescibacteria group bacterium]